MTNGEKHHRLINIHRSLNPLIIELRTVSKATLPDTPEREHIAAALAAAEKALAEVTAAIQGR